MVAGSVAGAVWAVDGVDHPVSAGNRGPLTRFRIQDRRRSAQRSETRGQRPRGFEIIGPDEEQLPLVAFRLVADSGYDEFDDALLLGRSTYEAFARDWPQITDPNPFTELMNSLPIYVASRTLTTGTWNPTMILSADVAAQVAELKQQPGRDLQIHGSARLVQSLLAADLIDEFRLVVAPVIVGLGRRLFPDGGASVGLRLVSSQTTPGGLTLQIHE